MLTIKNNARREASFTHFVKGVAEGGGFKYLICRADTRSAPTQEVNYSAAAT
jgi:hypothetical protein